MKGLARLQRKEKRNHTDLVFKEDLRGQILGEELQELIVELLKLHQFAEPVLDFIDVDLSSFSGAVQWKRRR